MSAHNVAIVIVTWNKKKFVLDLLDSISRLNYPNYDTIVVDNASTDGTAEAIGDAFPSVRLIRNSLNTGGAGGFNIGLQFAEEHGYKFCWLLDNDVVVEPSALTHLISALENRPDAAICGSQILISGSDTVQECGGYIDWRKTNVRLNNHGEARVVDEANSILEVDYCAACSLLVRMSDVTEFGKIDPEMFIFWDDIEWSTRLKFGGRKILCNTDSIVWHQFNGYKPSTPWRVYYRVRNKLYFFNQYKPDTSATANLTLLYQELASHYRFFHQGDYAYAIEQALSDFAAGIRGKWSNQQQGPQAEAQFDNCRLISGDYLLVYDHPYEKITHPGFLSGTRHRIAAKPLSFLALCKILLELLFSSSIAVGNQFNIYMPFANYAVLLTESGPRWIKNNKMRNLLFIGLRSGRFLLKFGWNVFNQNRFR